MEYIKRKSQRPRHRRGISLVWVAVLFMFFLGLLGLGVDVGYVYLSAHKLQNAADAAALAGAFYVRDDPETAPAEAQVMAARHLIAGESVTLEFDSETNAAGGDIVIGSFDTEERVFYRLLPPEYVLDEEGIERPRNAVQVTARRLAGGTEGKGPLNLFFGRIFGAETANISRTATGIITGTTGAGLIVLDPCKACSLDIGGSINLVINGGDIQVNSDASGNCPNGGAVCTSGSPVIETVDMNVVGTACLGNAAFSGGLNEGAPTMPDPLAYLEAPPNGPIVPTPGLNTSGLSSERVEVDNNQVATIEPGYYPNGIEVKGTLYMQPGIYVLGRPGGTPVKPGFHVAAQGIVVGHGVMLYLISKPQQNDPLVERPCLDGGPHYRGAGLRFSAGANITLSPPTEDNSFPGWAPYDKITIFQARNNVQVSGMHGGPGLNVTGAVYFPSTDELELFGGEAGNFGTIVVTNNLKLRGNGNIQVNYDGSFDAPGHRLALVK